MNLGALCDRRQRSYHEELVIADAYELQHCIRLTAMVDEDAAIAAATWINNGVLSAHSTLDDGLFVMCLERGIEIVAIHPIDAIHRVLKDSCIGGYILLGKYSTPSEPLLHARVWKVADELKVFV